MALRDQPYIPLYVQDFMTDEKLIGCSAEATGVYIRIICIMHKQEKYGTILLRQKFKQDSSICLNFASQLAMFLPYKESVIRKSLEELIDENVLQIEGDFLVQKRMVRDNEISLKRSKSGSKGGYTSAKTRTHFAAPKSIANNNQLLQQIATAKTQANTEYENEYENEYLSNTTHSTGTTFGKSENLLPNDDSTPELFDHEEFSSDSESGIPQYAKSTILSDQDYHTDVDKLLKITEESEEMLTNLCLRFRQYKLNIQSIKPYIGKFTIYVKSMGHKAMNRTEYHRWFGNWLGKELEKNPPVGSSNQSVAAKTGVASDKKRKIREAQDRGKKQQTSKSQEIPPVE